MTELLTLGTSTLEMRPFSVSIGPPQRKQPLQITCIIRSTRHRPCTICRGDLITPIGLLILLFLTLTVLTKHKVSAGSTSQQAIASIKGKAKELQPPYNVVITGGTKGELNLSLS